MTKTRPLQALRERISALQAEREAILRQRRSRAEVAAAADGYLAQLDVKGKEALARGLQSLAIGSASSPLILSGVAGADGVVRVDVGPLMVALLGVDRVRQAYFADLDTVPAGLSRADRNARIAEIATTLDELETEEECIVEESELGDQPIPRRPDARPEIVLGMKHE
jgi:hypothetical protein